MTLDRLGSFMGLTARPSVLYMAAFAAMVATILIPSMRFDLIAGAAYITAAWGGVSLLYGAKALEERGKAKSEADVEIARTGNDRRTPQPVIIENDPGDPVPVKDA